MINSKKIKRSKTPKRKLKKKEYYCCIDNYLHIAYIIVTMYILLIFYIYNNFIF